jgi:hypothetical protein
VSDYSICWSGDVDGCWKSADALIREVFVLPDGVALITVSAAFPTAKWDTLGHKQSLWKLTVNGDVLLCRTMTTEVRAGLVRARVLGIVEPERVED